MKYLFIVQGEGRGHLTQCIALEEILRNSGNEVVEILVGKSNARNLPGFFSRSVHAPIKRFESPNFLPSASNKRSRIPRSVAYNLMKTPVFLRSIRLINRRIRETNADAVINFYELLTGLAYAVFPIQVPQICIGHQYLFLHKDFGMPRHPGGSSLMLNFFSRLTSIGAYKRLALSFKPMEEDPGRRITVVPPLLRKEVFRHKATDGDYIHGYMVNAGFGENVMEWHRRNPSVPLRFFWDKKGAERVRVIDGTLSFYQLDDTEFLRQMSGCKAYASTAGFESICEAMYLGKPILMVPAHIEQDFNAIDAENSGAGIVSDDFNLDLLVDFAMHYRPNEEFRSWVRKAPYIIMKNLPATAFCNEAVGVTGHLSEMLETIRQKKKKLYRYIQFICMFLPILQRNEVC